MRQLSLFSSNRLHPRAVHAIDMKDAAGRAEERAQENAASHLADYQLAMRAGEAGAMRTALQRLDRIAVSLNGGALSGSLAAGGGKRRLLDRWRQADGLVPDWGVPGRFCLDLGDVIVDVQYEGLWGSVAMAPVWWDRQFLVSSGHLILHAFELECHKAVPKCELPVALERYIARLRSQGLVSLVPLLDTVGPDVSDPAWWPNGFLCAQTSGKWRTLPAEVLDGLLEAA